MVRWAMSVAVGRGGWGCLSTTRENGSFFGGEGDDPRGAAGAKRRSGSFLVRPFFSGRLARGC